MRRDLLPYTQGAYVNYADEELENYLNDYYGDNLPRLVEVKNHFDCSNIFNYPQSIPTSLQPHTRGTRLAGATAGSTAATNGVAPAGG